MVPTNTQEHIFDIWASPYIWKRIPNENKPHVFVRMEKVRGYYLYRDTRHTDYKITIGTVGIALCSMLKVPDIALTLHTFSAPLSR